MPAPDLNSPEAQAAYQAEEERKRQEAAEYEAYRNSGAGDYPVAEFFGGMAEGAYNALDDTFSAEQVSGPSGGSWGQSGTAAAAQNAAHVSHGRGIAGAANGAATSLNAAGREAATRAAPTTNYARADRYEALGEDARGVANKYLGQAGSSAQQQAQLAALNSFASQGQGPSAAQAQLQAGSDAAQRGALSMARSGRGAGESASALRDATFANASTQAQTNQAAAGLRAQEDAAFRERQLSALNSAMSGAGQIRGADATATQLAQGMRGQDQASQAQAAGQSQFNTSSQLQQTGLNDAARQGLVNSGLGYAQMGTQADLGFSQLGQQALDSQAQYELEQQQMKLDAAKANQSADLEKDSGLTGMVSTGLGALAMFSDERVKKIERQERALADALETVGNAPGYSYRYNDPSQPGAKEGRMVGPMAQDIERGPLGDSIVSDTPQGKMVDPGRLEMVNTSAITELNQKVKALEAALGRSAA